jgi:hypothetical protein
MGDLSHIMPTVHPYAGGATGAGHGADYRVVDHTRAVTNPAKALAMTVIDLLADDAHEAQHVLADFKPRMTRSEYVNYLRRLSTTELFRAADLER